MTYVSSAPGAAYYPQTAAPQYAQAAAPVSAPSAYGQGDRYQPVYAQSYGVPMQQAQETYSPINKQDLMLGVGGAVGGFFLAGLVGLSGPIGALILGVALLAISAGGRAIKHNSQKKQQEQMMQAQQMPQVHPGFQQSYAGPAYSQQQISFAPQQQTGPSAYMPQQPQVPMMQQPYQQGYPQQQPQGAPYGQPPQQESFWSKLLRWL